MSSINCHQKNNEKLKMKPTITIDDGINDVEVD